ncbi:SRPBCC family protein [Nibrella saemangeumensis]|uniref:SRPBCC family protein n=1 Tax=Nibrella saemangeumensis TaxID=1084526 RepID=A0ABP8NFC8_9BACT
MAEQQKRVSDVLGMSAVAPDPSGSSRINVGDTERIISAAGGAVMTAIGVQRGTLGGAVVALLGGYLIFRGASGYCPVSEAIGRDSTTSDQRHGVEPLEISRSVTINKPREEVYRFWRQLENLPTFMQHLERVTQIDTRRSHWEAKPVNVPGLSTLEWDAEIIEEEENSRIVWKSVPGATVDNAGEVRFTDAPNNRGTEVHATIRYQPPAGALGGAVAKLFNPLFKEMVREDIRRFKRYMETGEVPVNSIKSQPAAYQQSGTQPQSTSSRPQEPATALADQGLQEPSLNQPGMPYVDPMSGTV